MAFLQTMNDKNNGADGAHLLPTLPASLLPATWQARVDAQLAAHEAVLAGFEFDLDARLNYAPGIVVLTDQRLLACSTSDGEWRNIDLRAGR